MSGAGVRLCFSLFPSNELLGAESDSDNDKERGFQLLNCSFFLFGVLGVSRDVKSQIKFL